MCLNDVTLNVVEKLYSTYVKFHTLEADILCDCLLSRWKVKQETFAPLSDEAHDQNSIQGELFPRKNNSDKNGSNRTFKP